MLAPRPGTAIMLHKGEKSLIDMRRKVGRIGTYSIHFPGSLVKFGGV